VSQTLELEGVRSGIRRERNMEDMKNNHNFTAGAWYSVFDKGVQKSLEFFVSWPFESSCPKIYKPISYEVKQPTYQEKRASVFDDTREPLV